MYTDEEIKCIRYVAAKAENTWGIGGDDITLTFKIAPELEPEFKIKGNIPSKVVYIDMSIANALEFAESLVAAIQSAVTIEKQYNESRKSDE